MAKLEALAKEKGEGKPLEPRSKGYMVFLIIFMGMVGLMDNFLSLVEGPALPYILDEFGVTAQEFAFWQGIYGIITFSVFFIAWIADAYGRKKGLLVLILVMGVPALLIGFTAFTFHMFMLLYALVITATLSNMWELPITEESVPEKRGFYGGLVFLIGLIPLYAFLAVAIAESIGWRWCYGIMGFYMIILLVLLLRMKEPQRWLDAKEQREHRVLKIKEALKSLKRKDYEYILISIIVYTVWTISFKIAATWGGYYYINIIGYTPTEYSRILMIGGLLLMLGALLSGVLLDKLGRKITLIVGCLGSVIGITFMGITSNPIFYWMIYFFMPIVLAWIMVYFNEIFPTEVRSTAVGVTNTMVRAAYVIGPMLALLLLILFPDMGGFWVVTGLIMLIPLLSLFMKPYETKGKSLEAIQEER
ncbi:MAG: MFS transporter [Candidatus Hermodarchaeota archaeon]